MEELIVPTVQESIDNGIRLFNKYLSKVRAALEAIAEFKAEFVATTKLPVEIKYSTWSGDSKFEDPSKDKRIDITIYSPDRKFVVNMPYILLLHTGEELRHAHYMINLSDDVVELKKQVKVILNRSISEPFNAVNIKQFMDKLPKETKVETYRT